MYLPQAFDHPSYARQVMRAYPFASLVSNGPDGVPVATALPLHLMVQEGGEPSGQGAGDCLLGHVALGNPHGRLLAEQPQALVIFNGPSAYMSPSVYPDAQRVPTWSYIRVQAKVQAHMLGEAVDKDRLLKHLIGDHEPAYAAQWRGLSEDYTSGMLKRITAFELRITEVKCALKLNQHRPEAHAAMAEQLAAGGPQEQALLVWMKALKLV
jgi:transcriptional regulator